MKDDMQDEYRKPYLILFNGITDALALIRECRWAEAEALLMRIQMNAEDAYVNIPAEICRLQQCDFKKK